MILCGGWYSRETLEKYLNYPSKKKNNLNSLEIGNFSTPRPEQKKKTTIFYESKSGLTQ